MFSCFCLFGLDFKVGIPVKVLPPLGGKASQRAAQVNMIKVLERDMYGKPSETHRNVDGILSETSRLLSMPLTFLIETSFCARKILCHKKST